MDSTIGQIDALPLSATELLLMRDSAISMVKRIDHILSNKNIQGKQKADFILKGTCTYYNINPQELKQRVRKAEYVEQRQMIAYLLKTYTDRSLHDIADMIGYKQHATVLYHVKEAKSKLSDELYGEKEFKVTYRKLLKRLNL